MMQPPALPEDEQQRLAALRRSGLLDSPGEERFDRLTRLARALFDVPIVLISLIDENRQWFKSRQGLEVCETSREISFCGHAILDEPVFVVGDASQDARFADNPLVTGAPHIRFYAGAPLHFEGQRLGTLCLIDRRPRQLDAEQLARLRDLADTAERELHSAERDVLLARRQADMEQLQRHERGRAAVIAGAGIAIWEWDVGAGLIEIDPHWRDMLGSAPTQRVGELDAVPLQTWDAQIHPADIAGVQAARQRFLDGDLTRFDAVYRMRHAAGHWLWFEDYASAVKRDARGRTLRATGTHVEISQRVDAELTLKRTHDLLKRSSEAARIGTWELDLDAGRPFWSPVTCAIHEVPEGFSPDLDEAISFYAEGPSRQTILRVFNQAVASGEHFDEELQIVTARGTPRWVRSVGIADLEDGRCVRIYGLFQDISERKQAELAQQEALRLVRLQAELALDANLQGSAPERAWPRLAEWLAEALGVARASIWLFDESGQSLRCISMHRGDRVQESERAALRRDQVPHYFQVLQSQSMIAAEDALSDPACAELAEGYLRENEIGAMLDVVIAGDSGARGVLCMEHVGGPRPWTAAERGFANAAAACAAQLLAQQERQQAAARLAEREAQYRSLIEDVPGAAFRCALGARREMLFLSDGIEALVGCPAQRFLGPDGLSFDSVIHPDDRERLADTVREALDARRSWECEYRVLHRDGGERWVAERGHPVIDAGGNPIWLSGFLHDVDQRRRSEQERARVSALLQAVLDSASEISVIATDTQGLITLFNRGAERMLGYSAEEMVGRRTPECLHVKEEVIRRGAELEAELGEPVSGFRSFVALAEARGSDVREWTYVHRSGRTLPVMLAVTTIRDPRRAIEGYLGMAFDVSAQHEARKALVQSQRELQRFFDLSLGFMVIIDRRGRLARVNATVCRALGLREQDLVGRPLIEFVHPDDVLETGRQLGQLDVAAAEVQLEHRLRRSDGESLSLLWSLARDPASGRIYGAAVDITERQRVERMKTEFISTVSHELRTPLTSINGALGLVVSGTLGELGGKASQLLQVALDNGRRLALLINDLLDMEKLDADRMVFAFEWHDVAELLTSALLSHEPFAAERGVSLSAPGLAHGMQIEVDLNRFLQVIANLVSNAIKFSPRGGIVEITAVEDAGQVQVSVHDDGPGVPAAFRSRIFQKFSQADSSDVRERGGTGLGLAISRELVEKMGGRIGFHSTEGEGATFWLVFPARRRDGTRD